MPIAFMIAMNIAMTRNAPGGWMKMAMGSTDSGRICSPNAVPLPRISRTRPASVSATVQPTPIPMPSIIDAYQMKQGNATSLTIRLVGLCSRFGLPCPMMKCGLKNGSQTGATTIRHTHAARTRSSRDECFLMR